ncbi:MAG: AAA family ATPase, partial [bacterium]|nr:AAA family ATPase [bacterium]
ILFVCGGAFVVLDTLIRQRVGRQGMGFEAKLNSAGKASLTEIINQVLPEDLLKYGLIPEFVGRLPVVATLGELDEEAMVRVLTEPRNALVKQFQKLIEFENVTLRFTESAIRQIAIQALEHKTGARGLRSILEDIMLETMFDLPSMSDVKEIVINENVVHRKESPLLVFEKAS